jgi:outer membrane protein OmpA-like peptidoglycan-associated protein
VRRLADTTRRKSGALLSITALCAAAAGLSACGRSPVSAASGGPTATSALPTTPPASRTSVTSPPTSPPTTSPSATTTPPTTAPPVTSPPTTTAPPAKTTPSVQPEATTTFVLDESIGPPQSYTVSVDNLDRDGPYLRLDFTITCRTANVGGCDGEFQFAPPDYDVDNELHVLNTVAGVQLVDPVNAEEYSAVTDRELQPMVAELLPGIDNGQTEDAWATFKAPPTGVHQMDITLPNGGPLIEGVPITSVSTWSPPGPQGPFDRPVTSTDTQGLALPTARLDLDTYTDKGAVKEQQQANRANVTLSSDVLFAFNSARLSPAATHILAGVAKQINSRATGTVSVVGYTDSIGSTSYNLALSKRRAAAVVARIAPLIHGVTLRPSGRGEADPVAPNTNADGSDNPAGRAQNRRVTLTYSLKPPKAPAATKKTTTATPHLAGRPGRTVRFETDAAGQSTDTYRLRVNSLRRDGDLSVMQMKLTCVASSEEQTCQSNWDFTRDPTYEDALNYFNGFQLYDPTSGTTYLVAANSQVLNGPEQTPTPLTTDTNYELTVGESEQVWLYFANPPASSSTMSVQIPSGPRIAGVPLSS